MKNEMTIQQPLSASMPEYFEIRIPRPAIFESLARWAAVTMQRAHEDVRRYEAACEHLGSEAVPYDAARNARLAKTGSLYAACFPELGDVL